MATNRVYKARVIDHYEDSCLVAVYYTSPNLGTCDVEYLEIVLMDEQAACNEALTAYRMRNPE